MSTAEMIRQEAEKLSEEKAQEVLDFIRFLFTDLTVQKKRPVLVVRELDSFGDFIAMPVTTRSQHGQSLLLNPHLLSGLLPQESWLRTDRVMTLHQEWVVKELARVDETLIGLGREV